MKISSVIALLAAISPCVSAVRGAKKSSVPAETRRRLKGDKDDEDGDDILGDIGDAGDIIDAVGCFSEMATVQVQGASEPVSMADLSVGDFVLSNDGSYQQVYAWGHKSADQKATFVQLYTNSEEPLELTGEHLVYVAGKTNPVRADSVQTGDVLEPNAEVRKIQQIQRKGVYTPLTTTGQIVVNNIHASSYISLQADENVQIKGMNVPFLTQQNGIHMALSPYRMVCQYVMECNTQNENGMPTFVDGGIQVIMWAQTQSFLFQFLFLGLAFCVASACMVLENSIGLPLLVSAAYAATKVRASSKAKSA